MMNKHKLVRDIRFATSMEQQLFHHSRFASPTLKTNEANEAARTQLHVEWNGTHAVLNMMLFIKAFRIYHGEHDVALRYVF